MRAEDAAPVVDSAPVGTRQNYFRAPYREGSFRHMDRIFPFHVVHRAGAVSELPRDDHQLGEVTYQWNGAAHTLEEFLQQSKTTGFLVIKDGKVASERYFGGASETSDLHLDVGGEVVHLDVGGPRARRWKDQKPR